MGKRGKAARKRRRENEVNSATAIVPKLLKRSNAPADNSIHQESSDSDVEDDLHQQTGIHGISDAALETTVATLHRLSGLIDSSTGKHALKDRRYRSLRKVLYELQSTSSGAVVTQQTTNNGGTTQQQSLASLLASSSESKSHNISISSSKVTCEISAQIDNGAHELAVSTLRTVRRLQQEHQSKLLLRQSNKESGTKNNNDVTTGAANNAKTKHANDHGYYLRPKLGAVQRWVRQIDAAGTHDPLAIEVLDAILRVVAPEAILPVDKSDMEKAIWAKLGVSAPPSSSSSEEAVAGGNGGEGGSIRLFAPFDRRVKDGSEIGTSNWSSGGDRDIVDDIVSCMYTGEDGIRMISWTSCGQSSKRWGALEYRGVLFRKCGYEQGQDRRPPNKYDLQLVTTSAYDETKLLLECTDTESLNIDTFSGKDILADCTKRPSVVKTPLPYVQDSFLLENVLSPGECDRLIASAETAGYHPDEPVAGQPGASILAHACVWVVDHKLERAIFDRVKPFLPTFQSGKQKGQEASDDIETLQPLGLNRRFRFYRYVPGRYYRPHIDGAWPPSGFDCKGNYRYDVCDEDNKNGLQFVQKEEEASQGNEGSQKPQSEVNIQECQPKSDESKNARRQLSRLTFLIYLNDDFDAGYTTFLLPAKEKEGILNAFPVNPVRGGVLVFPHGTGAAPLHEGSPVLKRCKYVVRTEVEYYV